MKNKYIMLSKYNNFIEDKLLESLIQESIIYFTPPLRKILKGIESDISKDLLSKIYSERLKELEGDKWYW